MLVAVNAFGSIWSRRFGKDAGHPYRFTQQAAYFNTTGVMVRGKIRHRSRIFGHARFNPAGGFDPHRLPRMIDQVFECAEPCAWQGRNKVLFQRRLRHPQRPDYFLIVVSSEQTGPLDADSAAWKSDDTVLISFSDCRERQEVMLLMPAYSWVCGNLGTFFVEPSVAQPWIVEFRLGRSA